MKTELCSFTGYKIYPGRGRRYVRIDGKLFHFLDGKTQSLFHQKKNPRKIAWTVVYRRKHRKGLTEEATKRRTRKTVKYQRAIGTVNKEDIIKKQQEKPELRKQQREQALRAAKEKAKAEAAKKVAAAKKAGAPKAGAAKAAAAPKVAKAAAKGRPNVGGKR